MALFSYSVAVRQPYQQVKLTTEFKKVFSFCFLHKFFVVKPLIIENCDFYLFFLSTKNIEYLLARFERINFISTC